MDSPSPLPHSLSASPTLASTGTVLPHDDQASKQLADQASHLTLSTAGSVPSSYLPTASSAPFAPICPHEGSPKSSRSRGRSCSAELGPSSSAAAAAAQRCCCLCCSPPISHEHAREATRMRDGAPAAASEDERRHIWPAAANAATADGADTSCPTCTIATEGSSSGVVPLTLAAFPNEVLLHILGYLDVSDLLAASRVSCVRVELCRAHRPLFCVCSFCLLWSLIPSPLATLLSQLQNASPVPSATSQSVL